MDKEGIIRVKKGKGRALKPGHPWIFKGQLTKPATGITPGTIVSVIDESGKFIGRGYYNPKSNIAIRLFTFTDEPIDKNFLQIKIIEAVEKRKDLLSITNAYRAVFSEADALPGLIVDIYNDTAVLQVLTLGMEKLKSEIADIIDEVIKPKYIYEKSASPFRKLEGMKDTTGWWGDEGRERVEIYEGKVKFIVDIVNGHKTGFYLDQRKSRMAIGNIAKDKSVLDLFCYTGGFSVSAAVCGAGHVTGADIKEEWLALARENAALNNISQKINFVKGDAFAVLKNIKDSGEKFDIIILDPPSFLKTKESIVTAAKGYRELNALAMKLIKNGGVLATFSCSHNMPNELFSNVIKDAAAETNMKFTILRRCHQAEDHPIIRAVPETEYLKGYFLKISE